MIKQVRIMESLSSKSQILNINKVKIRYYFTYIYK